MNTNSTKHIQLLDCTLRDGGYVNDFRFGKNGIKKIIRQLTLAGIDIVECGFLEDGEYDEAKDWLDVEVNWDGVLRSKEYIAKELAYTIYNKLGAAANSSHADKLEALVSSLFFYS